VYGSWAWAHRPATHNRQATSRVSAGHKTVPSGRTRTRDGLPVARRALVEAAVVGQAPLRVKHVELRRADGPVRLGDLLALVVQVGEGVACAAW